MPFSNRLDAIANEAAEGLLNAAGRRRTRLLDSREKIDRRWRISAVETLELRLMLSVALSPSIATSNAAAAASINSRSEIKSNENPDPPTQLAFTRQPASGFVSAGIGVVTVAVEDAGGNTVTTDDSYVRITLSNGDGGATSMAQAVDGIATFANLDIPAAGSYTLTATDDALAVATSGTFAVYGPAAKLAFTGQQAGGTANSTIDPFVVNVEDSGGNIVTSDNSNVTLTLTSGSFSTGLSTATIAAVNGVATFDNLTVASAGSNTVTASDGPISSTVSRPFTIYLRNSIASFIPELDGSGPTGGVALDTYGNLFGTTQYGGASGNGTVFEIAKATTTAITVASFNNVDGSSPTTGVIIDTLGNLFGATQYGGANGDGTIFEIVHGETAIDAIASFDDFGGGYNSALSLDTDGNLFGTDGANVFEIASGTSVITDIASFTPGVDGTSPIGAIPNGAIPDTSGNLWGATQIGGPEGTGTVFEVAAGASVVTTIAGFNDLTTGYDPVSGLTIDSNGNLYGMTSGGGPGVGYGTVFEICKGTTAITAIASINVTNTDGSYSSAALTIDSSGNVFGTTRGFSILPTGFVFPGTIFEIYHGANSATTLAAFDDVNDLNPQGVALDSAGDLFGTTSAGGTAAAGSAFELTPTPPTLSFVGPPASTSAGGVLNGLPGVQVSVNYSWGNIVTDDTSIVTLTLSNGIFSTGANAVTAPVVNGIATFNNLTINAAGSYTLTASDGSYTPATSAAFTVAAGPAVQLVFASQPAGGTVNSTLDPFVVNVEDSFGNAVTGDNSNITVTLNGGLFATGLSTETMAADDGVATFSDLVINTAGSYQLIATDGSLVTASSRAFGVYGMNNIASFIKSSDPQSVILDSDGDLFGTTAAGGASDQATIFEILRGETAIDTLASVDPEIDGYGPSALAIDSAGDLFGTTPYAGANNLGQVFELSSGANSIITVASFNGADGSNPEAGVSIDAAGDIFGTTLAGGDAGGDGTVFEILHGATTISTLAAFNNVNGANPYAAVTLNSSGDLFGTTANGGSVGKGTIFEIVHGTTTVNSLASFNGTNGAHPFAGVTLDANGDLFGATEDDGGPNYSGGLFELSRGSSEVLALASFGSAEDNAAAIVLDSNGDLFGTTNSSATFGPLPRIFELARGATFISTLASFDHGALSTSLAIDSSGNLFGTTNRGGDADNGAVFEMTLAAPTLSFTTPPAATTAGNIINSPSGVQATVDYPWGNPISSDTTIITLALSNGIFSTGSNTATATVVNGVATFNNLTIDAVGSYTLTASDGSYTPATSAAFTVTPAPNSVSGQLFDDVNDNGVQDPGEAPLAGWTVTLTPTTVGGQTHDSVASGSVQTHTMAGAQSAVTDADGGYYFFGVAAGNYVVGEIVPSGYAVTAGIAGSGTVAVIDGQASAGPVFGSVAISTVTLNFNVLVALSQDYGKPGTFANGDLNGDGIVNFNDLVLLSQNYNKTLPAGAYGLSMAQQSAVIASTAIVSAVAPSTTVQQPAVTKAPLPVTISLVPVPAFAIASARIEPLHNKNEMARFYSRNNGVGATVGTRHVLAFDPTLSIAAGLLIRDDDADGSGLLEDADFGGDGAKPTARSIRIDGPEFLVISTTPCVARRSAGIFRE